MALYVDGALVGSRTDTTGRPVLQRLLAGRRRHGLAGGELLRRPIDEVALYPTALTARAGRRPLTPRQHGSSRPNVAPTARFTATRRPTWPRPSTARLGRHRRHRGLLRLGLRRRRRPAPARRRAHLRGGRHLPVTLTVTDDDGAPRHDDRPVTVVAPPAEPCPDGGVHRHRDRVTVAVDGRASATPTAPSPPTPGTSATARDRHGRDRGAHLRRGRHLHRHADGHRRRRRDRDAERDRPSRRRWRPRRWPPTASTAAWPAGSAPPSRRCVDGAGTCRVGLGVGRSGAPAGLGPAAQRRPGCTPCRRGTSTLQTDLVAGQAATGGGTYVYVAGRRVGTNQYRAAVRFLLHRRGDAGPVPRGVERGDARSARSPFPG